VCVCIYIYTHPVHGGGYRNCVNWAGVPHGFVVGSRRDAAVSILAVGWVDLWSLTIEKRSRRIRFT
jgi:hypothetical protein